MDFPLFFLDYFGNRMLIAVIAVVHVFINHPFAVGAYPLVTLIEWWAHRTGNQALDQLAYKVTFVLFVVTTTVGALTGVGIWFSAGLISPFGIGSLLRVFFWAWFTEWLVFITEVGLILVYFLMWKRWASGGLKKLHIATGAALSGFSWLTMMIIVAILSFMMGTGSWTQDHSFFSAFFNDLYGPQLMFRTCYAMLAAGLLVWFLTFFFTKKAEEVRRKAVRFVSGWIIFWAPLTAAGAFWYWHTVPGAMLANVDVGMMTQAFSDWHDGFARLIAIAAGLVILIAIVGLIRPRFIPRVLLLLPFVINLWMLGHFERVREFIRKPHVVADYMYSNGVTMDELPVFQRDGILHYATYVGNKRVTSENKVSAGHDVFMIACSRCHTSTGLNGIVNKFNNLYGTDPWDENALAAFIPTMHVSRTYMPPFPGNEKEAEALVAWLKEEQQSRATIYGAQSEGIRIPPPPAAAAQ